jgi:hypothetical protein
MLPFIAIAHIIYLECRVFGVSSGAAVIDHHLPCNKITPTCNGSVL